MAFLLLAVEVFFARPWALVDSFGLPTGLTRRLLQKLQQKLRQEQKLDAIVKDVTKNKRQMTKNQK